MGSFAAVIWDWGVFSTSVLYSHFQVPFPIALSLFSHRILLLLELKASFGLFRIKFVHRERHKWLSQTVNKISHSSVTGSWRSHCSVFSLFIWLPTLPFFFLLSRPFLCWRGHAIRLKINGQMSSLFFWRWDFDPLKEGSALFLECWFQLQCDISLEVTKFWFTGAVHCFKWRGISLSMFLILIFLCGGCFRVPVPTEADEMGELGRHLSRRK